MTEEMTIEQQNVVIARFEGRLFFGKFPIDAYGPKTCNAYPVMKYHSSWDWLMPVYEKIKKHYYKTYEGNKDQDSLKRIFGNIQHRLLEANIENFRLDILVYIERLTTNRGDKK